MLLRFLIIVFIFTLSLTYSCSKLPTIAIDLSEDIDNTPPDVKLLHPNDGDSFNTTNIQVKLAGSDSGSGLKSIFIRVGDNGNFVEVAGETTNILLPGDGNYTLYYYGVDKKNNSSIIKSIVFKIDTVPPSVTVNSISNGSVLNVTNLLFAGTSSDDRSGVKMIVVEISNTSSLYNILGNDNWITNITVYFDGYYTASVWAYDRAGNVSSTQTINFTVDSSKPTVSVIFPTNGQTLNTTNLSIYGTCNDNLGGSIEVWLKIDGGSSGTFTKISQSPNWETNISLTQDGIYTIYVFSVDGAGNSSITQQVIFSVDTTFNDNTIPVVVISFPTNNSYFATNTITISGQVYDPAIGGYSGIKDVFCSLNSLSSFSKLGIQGFDGWETNFVGLSDGQKVFRIYSVDNAGNHSLTQSVTFYIDTESPTISITFPSSLSVFNTTSVSFSGTSSDLVSGINRVMIRANDNLSFSVASVSGGPWSTNLSLKDGTNIVYVFSEDKTGNTSITQSVSVIVKERPSVSIVSPTNYQEFDDTSVLVFGTASDLGSEVDSVKVSINGGPYTSAFGKNYWSINLTNLYDGTNLLRSFGVDIYSNYSSTQEVLFLVKERPQVQVHYPVSNQVVRTNSVQVVGVSYDKGSGVNKVFFRLGNSGTFGEVSGTTNWTTNLTGLQDGTNTIQVFATDKSNNHSYTNNIQVFIGIPPTLQVTYPTNNQSVNTSSITIQGTASDDASGVKEVWFRLGNTGDFGKVSGTTSWSTNVSGLSDGTNIFYIFAVDTNGNVSQTQSVVFIVDTDFPTVSITSPSANQVLTSSSITVTGTATGSISGISSVWLRLGNSGGFGKVSGTT
ncbi:MAG: Ig-like domain-containing protein, partial [Spirochaetia bacterium]|nr:Ig-like domain-containing protein [Spirochaetota bacterium]MDW8112183.1 Ig-like domain-containing protein [Spirochaetia bacterium]